MLKIIYSIYYCIVMFIGLPGNILIILSVYKFKKMRNVVNTFLANLAIADLLFVLLSVFDSVSFMYGEWKFGDIGCRIQSPFIEVSYTVSVLTLVVISIERYLSICKPYNKKRTIKQSIAMLLLIWIFSLCFCSVLFYGYYTKKSVENKTMCVNEYWTEQYRLMFYIIHSVIVYLLPLFLMGVSHLKISNSLMMQEERLSSATTIRKSPTIKNRLEKNKNNSAADLSVTTVEPHSRMRQSRYRRVSRRQKNVIRLLSVVTLIFFILWSPFVIIRLCMYSNVNINDMIWRGSQLFMFSTTSVNVIIYAFMSPSFRTSFKLLLTCGKTRPNAWKGVDTSRSMDISETTRNHAF